MPRGDNLSTEDRERGGEHSHSGNQSNGQNASSNRDNSNDGRGLASADEQRRERVAREGGEASH